MYIVTIFSICLSFDVTSLLYNRGFFFPSLSFFPLFYIISFYFTIGTLLLFLFFLALEYFSRVTSSVDLYDRYVIFVRPRERGEDMKKNTRSAQRWREEREYCKKKVSIILKGAAYIRKIFTSKSFYRVLFDNAVYF